MSANKNIKSRVQNKSDTYSNWANLSYERFIPLKGEIIFYLADPEFTGSIYGLTDIDFTKNSFKVGDGVNYIENLPFFSELDIPYGSEDEMYELENPSEGDMFLVEDNGILNPIERSEVIQEILNYLPTWDGGSY